MKLKFMAIALGLFLLASGWAVVALLGSAPPTEPYIDVGDESQNDPSKSGFQIASSAVVEGGLLPKEFTCDGKSVSSPITWGKAPANTKNFAIVMQHITGPSDLHWYWVVHPSLIFMWTTKVGDIWNMQH